VFKLPVALLLIALVPWQVTPALSTPEQIQEDFAHVPCRNKERLSAARKLFEKMGAPPEEFSLVKVRDAENLIVIRKGTEPGKVVIGAHYDFENAGCGAIDNWTGIVAMAHAYRSVKQLGARKTVIFAAFGNEEDGLYGSRGMARAIPDSEVPDYCAMINIDSFGMAVPLVFEDVSSDKLSALAKEKAAEMKIPINGVSLPSASADSASFVARRIPAVTLSGLSAQWESVLHTKKDQVQAVNYTSVYLGYRLALAVWAAVDASPCDTFKDDAPTLKKK
jgi:Zn-dependent M28 family amino/carboxypeptidase